METTLFNPENNFGQIQDFLPKQNLINLFSNLKNDFESYLSSYIDNCVKQSIKKHSSKEQSLKTDKELYLTNKEACKLLKISPTTLWRWSEDGRITKHFVYGNPRYSKVEVLSKIKTITSKI